MLASIKNTIVTLNNPNARCYWLTHTYGYLQDAVTVIPVQLRCFFVTLNTPKVTFFHASP